jgi:hypothetical protein
LPTHIRLGLPSGLFPSGFPTNILYKFLFSPTCHTRPKIIHTTMEKRIYHSYVLNVVLKQPDILIYVCTRLLFPEDESSRSLIKGRCVVYDANTRRHVQQTVIQISSGYCSYTETCMGVNTELCSAEPPPPPNYVSRFSKMTCISSIRGSSTSRPNSQLCYVCHILNYSHLIISSSFN